MTSLSTAPTSGSERLQQHRAALAKLTDLAKREPGYLPATLIPNTGINPRFNPQDFPHFVCFLAPTQISGKELLQMLPTRMEAKDLEAFRKGDSSQNIMGFVPTKMGRMLLGHIAHMYMNRHMPMLEGGTSIGKTYMVRALTRLIHGNKAKPLHFYCDGQTDTAELLAKYVPASHDPAAKLVTEFLGSDAGRTWLKTEYESGRLSDKTEPQRILFDAANHLRITLNDKSFTLSLGTIPKAAIARVGADGKLQFDEEKPGPGTILLVDEVGLAKGPVVMALLRLRGDGEMVNSFQLWEDGGREIPIGPHCLMVFASNTLNYGDRNPVDKALARSLNWARIGELTDKDIEDFVQMITRYDYGQKNTGPGLREYLDITAHPELYKLIGKAIRHAHIQMAPLANTAQSGGDRQQIPCTYEDLLKALKYCRHSQLVGDSGVDLPATILEAVATQYFSRIADPTSRTTNFTTFKQLFENDSGIQAVALRGKTMSLAAAIQALADEAWQEETMSLGIADPTILAELERQKAARNEIEAIDHLMDDLPSHTAEMLIAACKGAAGIISEEAKEHWRQRLRTCLKTPSDVADQADWLALCNALDGIFKVD